MNESHKEIYSSSLEVLNESGLFKSYKQRHVVLYSNGFLTVYKSKNGDNLSSKSQIFSINLQNTLYIYAYDRSFAITVHTYRDKDISKMISSFKSEIISNDNNDGGSDDITSPRLENNASEKVRDLIAKYKIKSSRMKTYSFKYDDELDLWLHNFKPLTPAISHQIVKSGKLMKESEYLRKWNERYFVLTNRGFLIYFHDEKLYQHFIHTTFCHKHTLKSHIERDAKGCYRIRPKKIKVLDCEAYKKAEREAKQNKRRDSKHSNDTSVDTSDGSSTDDLVFAIQERYDHKHFQTIFKLKIGNSHLEEYQQWMIALNQFTQPKMKKLSTASSIGFNEYPDGTPELPDTLSEDILPPPPIHAHPIICKTPKAPSQRNSITQMDSRNDSDYESDGKMAPDLDLAPLHEHEHEHSTSPHPQKRTQTSPNAPTAGEKPHKSQLSSSTSVREGTYVAGESNTHTHTHMQQRSDNKSGVSMDAIPTKRDYGTTTSILGKKSKKVLSGKKEKNRNDNNLSSKIVVMALFIAILAAIVYLYYPTVGGNATNGNVDIDTQSTTTTTAHSDTPNI